MRLIEVVNNRRYYRCNNYRLYFDGKELTVRCLWSPNFCSIRHGHQWGRRCVLDSGKYMEYYNGKSTS